MFVRTKISTSMNCNLHEPTYKCPQTCQRSNQLHCLIICMSFCVWFVSRIQWLQYVCRPINFPKAINGRESWGGYSIIMYFLLFPRLLRSRLHAMRRQHTQKSYVCTWISPPPISSPGTFKYCYSITRLNQTHVSPGKFEQVVKYEEPLILII